MPNVNFFFIATFHRLFLSSSVQLLNVLLLLSEPAHVREGCAELLNVEYIFP